jgi:hypothetical protein
MSQNPLTHLYRKKSLYVALPSKGKYYKDGIELSVDEELGVLPMTTADEIKLKSPDALFNGEAMFDMLVSCVPDIKNPREIPACDLDVLLFAIKIATTGDELAITSQCPHCEGTHDYAASLPHILSTAKEIDDDNIVRLDDNTEVHVRPYTLESQIKTNIKQFHNYRMEAILNQGEELSIESKTELFNSALASASQITIQLLADNILKVIIRDENDKKIIVDESKHIYEWVQNMSSEVYKKLVDRIKLLSDPQIQSDLTITCHGCSKEYKTNIDLDPVSFFT